MGSIRLDAGAIDIGALADVVDLRRNDEALRIGAVLDVPRCRLCRHARQRTKKAGELRPELRPIVGLCGDVAQHAGAIDKR